MGTHAVGGMSTTGTTGGDSVTVDSIQIRQYLAAAYSLYPHIVGKELDSKLWREKHTRYDWKSNLKRIESETESGDANNENKSMATVPPPAFQVPSEVVNCIVSWNLRDKKSFAYMIANRKVYIFQGQVLSDDPKKTMTKQARKKLKTGDIVRVSFQKLPHLPLCPAAISN